MSNTVVGKVSTFDTRTEARIPVESPLAYSYRRSGAPAPGSKSRVVLRERPFLGHLVLRGGAIVLDEAHALAGDDRGGHLAAVIERLVRLCGTDLQRIGREFDIPALTADRYRTVLNGRAKVSGRGVTCGKCKPAAREVLDEACDEASSAPMVAAPV